MRFYLALLHLYPSSFRGEYGAELAAVFAARLRAAGTFGAIVVWIDAILDTILSAAAVHFDYLRQDLRYALRGIRRAPGFAAAAVLLAGLGVGASTAVFTVTDHVLLRPLPFADGDRLVKIWESTPGYGRLDPSPANYRDWKTMSTVFETMAAYRSLSVNMAGQGDPERLDGASVEAELFPLLGVKPALGRLFTPEEDKEGATGTVLLSYGLWLSNFGGSPGVIGSSVLLDGQKYTVTGVMPRDFSFPNRDAEIWTAMRFGKIDFQDRNNNYLNVAAKLKPGVSIEQARTQMRAVAARLEQAYPADNKNTVASVLLMREEISQRSRVMLGALLAASGCLLLIACTNLANLLLARAILRRKELALRASLGAGRERLLRQLLTESVTLAVLGGCLGVLAAREFLPLLLKLVPQTLPIAAPSLDLRVLAFALALTAATGLGFGVLPSVKACGAVKTAALLEGSRQGVGGRRERLRGALVIVEVAVSVVLLVSAGLLLRALWRLQGVDPGFRAEGVLTLRTSLPMPKYEKSVQREQFYARVISEVEKLPGVTRAAYISFLPITLRGGIWPVSIDGRPADRAESQTASMRFVTPGFFETLRIPILAGRDARESDTRDTLQAAIVSESFVQRYWPGQDALGRHFRFAAKERTVVGIVGNVRVRGLESVSEPQVYMPFKQGLDGEWSWYAPKDLVVRLDSGSGTVLPAIRRIIRDADPEQPISDVRTLEEIVASDTETRRVQARVLGVFAALAFLLAGFGIYGLLSFTVSQRSQEFGVRMALGAQRRDILAMVIGESAVLALAGSLAGALPGYWAARAMEELLAGIAPDDAATFAAAMTLIGAMTLLGSLGPSLRAVRVSPAVALRED